MGIFLGATYATMDCNPGRVHGATPLPPRQRATPGFQASQVGPVDPPTDRANLHLGSYPSVLTGVQAPNLCIRWLGAVTKPPIGPTRQTIYV